MDGQKGRDKERSVRDMFARIAHRYDFVNRLMSWGQDARWRQLAVRLACPSRGRLLDVATGTGDLALELARYSDFVVGVDLCPEMLGRGQAKVEEKELGERIDFIVGDALALPFDDDSFDCAVNGFALRNVADVSKFLAELCRVLKPGGRVVCLELMKPATGIVGALYRFYLEVVVPVLGRWVSGDGKAYRYLPDSVDCFISKTELKRIMEDVGFSQVRHKILNFGTVALYFGVK